MVYWWEADPAERYWCEITDRSDVGANLWSPQRDETGTDYWSYSLIKAIWPGDVVFHYSTSTKSFVGASVAGGPLEERMISWIPHGTVGRSKAEHPPDRPGWRLPLYGYEASRSPLTLSALQVPREQDWIRGWITSKKTSGPVAAPLQLYPGKIRGAQGYLTKMPKEFVSRWHKLGELVELLSEKQDELTLLGDVYPPKESQRASRDGSFKPKREDDYVAIIKAGLQRRSRGHERLVRLAGEALRRRGAEVVTLHPFDLLITSPLEVLVEAKIVRGRHPGFAIREAIGQLLEYRHFLRPECPHLCILLDVRPGARLVEYVELALGIWIAWMHLDRLEGGPQTISALSAMAFWLPLSNPQPSDRSPGGTNS